jgi:hypothetical protein
VNRPYSETEAEILHPDRWGRRPTEREVTMVQALKPNEQQALLIPAIRDAFKQTAEETA